jgi:hypothetical protein
LFHDRLQQDENLTFFNRMICFYQKKSLIFICYKIPFDALCGLVVSVLATEPTGYSVAGSSPTEDGDKNP